MKSLVIVIVGRSAADPAPPNADIAMLKKIKSANVPVIYAETVSQDITLELKDNALSRGLVHYLMKNKISYQGIGLPLRKDYRLKPFENEEERLTDLITYLSTITKNIFELLPPKLPNGGIIYLNCGTILTHALAATITQHFKKSPVFNEVFNLHVLTAKISRAIEIENKMEKMLLERLPEEIIAAREEKESETLTALELDQLIDLAIRAVPRRAFDPKFYSPAKEHRQLGITTCLERRSP